MRFDPNLFETLNGLEASEYAMRLAEDGISEDDFLPYFQEQAGAMDAAHLEVAVFLLGRIGTTAAWRLVADYLDHPDFSVRFVATKRLREIDKADEKIMSRVVAALVKNCGDGLADELTVLLDRPCGNAARQVVLNYLASRPGNS